MDDSMDTKNIVVPYLMRALRILWDERVQEELWSEGAPADGPFAASAVRDLMEHGFADSGLLDVLDCDGAAVHWDFSMYDNGWASPSDGELEPPHREPNTQLLATLYAIDSESELVQHLSPPEVLEHPSISNIRARSKQALAYLGFRAYPRVRTGANGAPFHDWVSIPS